jgi:hypothetical protein
MSSNTIIRIIASILISFLVVFISVKIKRNNNNVYFVDIREILVSFAVSSYFFILAFSVFLSKQFKFSLFLILFSCFFFIIGFFVLFEYCKIDGKTLIVKSSRREKIDINKIISVKFLKSSGDANPEPCIDIAFSDMYIRVKSNMEDVNVFADELVKINPNIKIMNDVPKNKNIINSIITFFFLFFSINKLFVLFVERSVNC